MNRPDDRPIRFIAIDGETTGLDFTGGNTLIEIGAAFRGDDGNVQWFEEPIWHDQGSFTWQAEAFKVNGYSLEQISDLAAADAADIVDARLATWLDAAGDYVWDPRGKVLGQLRKAERSWQPLDQLEITKVDAIKRGKQTRYLVDFQTKVGVVYPGAYQSCFVFDRRNSQILSGSLIGVHLSQTFQPNRFTPKPCERVWN